MFMMQPGSQKISMPWVEHGIGLGYDVEAGNGTFVMQSMDSKATTMLQQQGNVFPQRPPGMFAAQPEVQETPITAEQGIPMQDTSPGVFMMQDSSGMIGFMPMLMPVYASTLQMPTPPSAWSEPKHSKWKQGRSTQRKKLDGAVLPQEMEEVKRAVQEAMKVQHKAPPAMELKRGLSGSTCCSTSEGQSETGVNDDSTEGSCKAPSEVANGDLEDLTHTPTPDTRFADHIDTAILDLDSNESEKRQLAFQWVSEAFWSLAFNKRGCRVVQKAMDVGTPAYQVQLLEHLPGHVYEAIQSPHANYVLQKFIEMVAPERIQFIVQELQENVLYIARHRFGCRILQRLLEHCAPWQTDQLINIVLTDAAALCRHQYGNFILQHILQYGSLSQRSAIAECVLADIMRLSKHRLASHIVSCALVNCSPEDIQRLTQAVLQDAGQLYQLSRREYGSFVVREVNRAARLLQGGSDQTGEDVTAGECA